MHRLPECTHRGIGIADNGVDVAGFNHCGLLGEFGDDCLEVVVPSPGIDFAVLVERKRVLFAGTDGNDVRQCLVDWATLTILLSVHRIWVSRTPAHHRPPIGQSQRVIKSGTDGFDAAKRLDEVLLNKKFVAPADHCLVTSDDERVFMASGNRFDVADAGDGGLSLAVATPADDSAVVFEGDDVAIVSRDSLDVRTGTGGNVELTEVVLSPGINLSILAKSDSPVGADLDLLYGNVAQRSRECCLPLPIESPGNHGAVVEHA